MRILIISGSLPPMKCGVGDYTAHLANALARTQNTTVAVLTDVDATPIPSEFEFEVLPIARGWRITDAGRIGMAVRRWKPDIVHIQYPTQGYGRRYLPWLLPSLFRLANVPVVQTLHGYDGKMIPRRCIPNSALAGGLITVRPEFTSMMSDLHRWLNRRKLVRFIPNVSTIPPVRLTDDERLTLKASFSSATSTLVVFFGFAYPDRGTELLFHVADPDQHHLALICDLDPGNPYHKTILDHIKSKPWAGKATVTGFLPAEQVGQILSACDALVLPFRDGGGMWNTSIRAGMAQGTFILTTSHERHGYDPSANVYYAQPDDVADMKQALQTFIGKRSCQVVEDLKSDWDAVARAHTSLYSAVISADQ